MLLVLGATAEAQRFLQEEYIKDEMRNLKRELVRAKEVRGGWNGCTMHARALIYHGHACGINYRN